MKQKMDTTVQNRTEKQEKQKLEEIVKEYHCIKQITYNGPKSNKLSLLAIIILKLQLQYILLFIFGLRWNCNHLLNCINNHET